MFEVCGATGRWDELSGGESLRAQDDTKTLSAKIPMLKHQISAPAVAGFLFC